jgi:murein DD-endopeptidase MepM/ murein hydrolase activator NlpD
MVLKGYRFLIVLGLLALLQISAGNKDESAELQRLTNENKVLHSQQNMLFSEISGLELKILNAQRILSKVYDRSDNRQLQIINLNNQLSVLKQEKKQTQRLLQKILLEEYKNRNYQSKLFFLASSENLKQFVNRLNYLKKLKRFRVKQLRTLESKQKELEEMLQVYTGSEKEKEQLASLKRQQIIKLNALVREKHKLYSKLEQEQQQVLLLMKEKNQKQGLIKRRDGKIEEKQMLKDRTGFLWPVENGLIIERFGVHKHKQERRIQVQNNGIDILVSQHEAVEAVGDGRVKSILKVPGYNTSVIIDHGGYHAVYANLMATHLEVGDSIKQGVKIATAAKDNNGVRKLHFELWNGIQKLNPEKYLEGELY